MEIPLIAWIFFGCFLGIFTGLSPGIHINTVAALATTMRFENSLGIALMIAGMSIVHSFIDFIPSILFGAPEESNFLAVLPGHRMLLKGNSLEAIKLTSNGALFSGIIALGFAPIFFLFVEKSGAFLSEIIPFVLLLVLAIMVFSEKSLEKKAWAIAVIALSGTLGIITLGEKSIVQNALFACITGFFGSATIIEALKQKTVLPEQKTKDFKTKKRIVFEGSLLGFLAGSIVSLMPAIGSNQAAFILKKVFGKISTKKFLVLLGGSSSSNMFLGFIVLFAWGKTRSGSAAAISELIELSFQNLLFLSIACIIALGIGFAITMPIAGFLIKRMQKIDYKKINLGILGILCVLVAVLSNPAGIVAFASATAIGLICVSKAIKRTNCMAFLMIPALMFYLGF